MLEIFPQLATERLDLIEIKPFHQMDFFNVFKNEKVARFYNIPQLREPKEAKVYLDLFELRFKMKTGIRWGIALKGQNNIIGTIGFNSFQKNHKGNFAYDLHFDFWNKGIVTEAAKEILNYAFQHLALNRAEAEVMIGNTGSERVLQKLGFTFEGVVRDGMFMDGNYYDIKLFSLLRKDPIIAREDKGSDGLVGKFLPKIFKRTFLNPSR